MVGPGGAKGGNLFATRYTRYGPDWSQIPITQRLGFTKAVVPERGPLPELPPASSEKVIRVSGVSWSDGAAMALWENDKGDSGVLKPGDFVDSWQVVEIRSDRVILKKRGTGELQEIMVGERKKPKPQPTGMPGMRPGGMPGMPGMPGMQPGGMPGMPGMQPGGAGMPGVGGGGGDNQPPAGGGGGGGGGQRRRGRRGG